MVKLFQISAIALACLAANANGHRDHKKRQTAARPALSPHFDKRQTSPALNPKLTDTIPNVGGPTLYYNGSGPVPPFVVSILSRGMAC